MASRRSAPSVARLRCLSLRFFKSGVDASKPPAPSLHIMSHIIVSYWLGPSEPCGVQLASLRAWAARHGQRFVYVHDPRARPKNKNDAMWRKFELLRDTCDAQGASVERCTYLDTDMLVVNPGLSLDRLFEDADTQAAQLSAGSVPRCDVFVQNDPVSG
eukprot:6534969-Prymnesium_polylepis.4